LAQLVGTTQSVISRIEDSDYDGHSLGLLRRIAEAMDKKLRIVFCDQQPENGATVQEFTVTWMSSYRLWNPEFSEEKEESTFQEAPMGNAFVAGATWGHYFSSLNDPKTTAIGVRVR